MFGFPLGLGTTTILCIDLGTDTLPAISLAYEEAESGIMRRLPRDPMTIDLSTTSNRQMSRFAYFGLVSVSYGQIGMMQAACGFFAYFVIMAENGFYPSRLFRIRSEWDNKFINDVEDSFGQQWPYSRRKALKYTRQSAFFVSVVLSKWATLLVTKTRRNSFVQQGMGNKVLHFAIVFETVLAGLLVYLPRMAEGLHFYYLRFYWWWLALPFFNFDFVYDEARRFLIRRLPVVWSNKKLITN